MLGLPKVNLRRTLLIARRDYLGYVKTWGFWISFFLPVVLGIIFLVLAMADINVAPKRYVAIANQAGFDHTERLNALLDEQLNESREETLRAKALFIPEKQMKDDFNRILDGEGYEAGLAFLEENAPTLLGEVKDPDVPFYFVDAPELTLDGLRPYLMGEKRVRYDGQEVALSGAMILKPGEGYNRPDAQYWSTNFNSGAAQRLLQRYMNRLSIEAYYGDTGITKDGYDKAFANAVDVQYFDPTKTQTAEGSQEVTMTDRVPYLAAAGLAVMLWLTIFSGSYMLLTSMIEEKLNKLLEMMLASTRFSEIIFGKLLGVAALTITAMAPYIILSVVGVVGYIFFGPDQDVVRGLIESFSAKTIIFLIIYLILGYVLYGAFFISLGAMSSSMQDAQTLTTPMMIVMTLCLMVVPLGVSSPDSPIIQIASFIPFSAPFAAIIRLPSDPPLWELQLSTAFLAALCVITIVIANRVFRYGVLSGAGATAVAQWFKRAVLRRR